MTKVAQLKKIEVVRTLAAETGLTQRTVQAVLDAQAKLAEATLKAGQSYPVSDLGKLVPVTRKPRQGHNPKTGESISIPETKAVTFRVTASLKREVKAA